MKSTTKPYSSLQEFAQLIAQALTNATEGVWTRSTKFDEDDQTWRAELQGPGENRLFISNTWSGLGRLYIGGTFPQGEIPYGVERPSITVADTKSAQQIANDIIRRLLPAYTKALETILAKNLIAHNFEVGRAALAKEVAKVVDGRVSEQMVYSGGWDLQVSGPDSIRIQGHCNYITLDQLRKIVQVCPELFRKAGE